MSDWNMGMYSDELRLALAAVLNIGLWAAAYRLARRRGVEKLQAVCDAFLLYFLAQYACVALPGTLGIFSLQTMSLGAVAAIVLMLLAGGWGKFALTDDKWDADALGLLACGLFTCGYLLAFAFISRFAPPVATDPLVYHLPMAVQWIQTGKLGIFPTWYWNPAASYSPASGSTFMAWWMALAGNDVLVRFVQLPPLIFIFFLVARMCRLMGCGKTVAGLVAMAAALSRPLFSEALIQKDDLFVTSFIVAAVLSLATEPLRDRVGAWRVGISIGMVLASKYTALLCCPIFLFVAGSPFAARWRKRQWMIAIGLVLLIALPWYVRNIVLTGNPLYPVDIGIGRWKLAGLFGTERDQQLQRAAGVWKMLSATYNSVPPALIALLAAGWVWALWAAEKSSLRDPLTRACLLGSFTTLVIFLATSPHHEVRYVFPLIVLWFAACGMALARGMPRSSLRLGAAGILAAVSIVTSLDIHFVFYVILFTSVALFIAFIGVGLVVLQTRVWRMRPAYIAGVCLIPLAVAAMLTFVYWHSYVREYAASREVAWGQDNAYPGPGPVWNWMDEKLPANAHVAYANTFLVYPYYGFEYTRHVGYAPVRKGLHDFAHFPRMGDRVPGDLIVQRMTQVMDADADEKTWLENLRTMGAEYLVVMKSDPNLDLNPPELKMARETPGIFSRIYEDGVAEVFRIEQKNH